MEVFRIRPCIGFSLLLGWVEVVRDGVVIYLFVGEVEECAVVDASVASKC